MFAHKLWPAILLAFLSGLAACGRRPIQQDARFQAPDGFSIELAAPSSQTGSLIALTFDSFGRPVVSKENGHPTILIDRDSDGVFESERIFSDKVKNLQGMWFDGRTLYAVGNNTVAASKGQDGQPIEKPQAGLYKLEDTDGDDVADTFERLNTFDRSMGEHGPHDIQRGPSGNPTLMLGNHTFVPLELINQASPAQNFKESQLLPSYNDARGHAADIKAPGGALFELDLTTLKYTLLTGGFRNAYAHAHNLDGEAFTFDSDMEWDINLPWYRPVRTVHMIPGGDYGWRTGSANTPSYFVDYLPPLNELGRGSPVGVDFYQHHVYPKGYRDAFLEGDWSRGRILLTRLERSGGSYRAASAPIELVHGEPLNVTDLDIGPDGFVYFTMGGRETEGGFYRVRYHPGRVEQWWRRWLARKSTGGVRAIVRQPQPLSSWGHAMLLQAKQKMGDRWAAELEQLAGDPAVDETDRVQALFILQRLGPAPRLEMLKFLRFDRRAGVRAAAIYLASLQESHTSRSIAAAALKDPHPFVRRRAAEALVRLGVWPESQGWAPIHDVYALLNDPDRFVRYAGRVALERIPPDLWKDRVFSEQNPFAAIEGAVALTRVGASLTDLERLLEKQLSMLQDAGLTVEHRLRLIRALHLTAMEMPEGLNESQRKRVHELVSRQFPARDEHLTREYARTLAYCGQPEAIRLIMAAMPKDEQNPQLQIHYVYCLRVIKQGWTSDQKRSLLDWFAKASSWRGGASFPGFINLMFDSSLEFFDQEEKKMAYERLPDFAPLEDAQAALRQQAQAERARVFARQKGVQGVSAEEIFEFQMFDPMTTKAKPEKGKALFEKECASCHLMGGVGKDFGPDLTTITSRFKKKDVLEAVLWPSKIISDQYQSYIIETKDNDRVNGLLVSEDDQKIVVKTAEVQRPIELPKSSIRSRRISKISIMPDNLLNAYPMDQISSLMAFILIGGKSEGNLSQK